MHKIYGVHMLFGEIYWLEKLILLKSILSGQIYLVHQVQTHSCPFLGSHIIKANIWCTHIEHTWGFLNLMCLFSSLASNCNFESIRYCMVTLRISRQFCLYTWIIMKKITLGYVLLTITEDLLSTYILYWYQDIFESDLIYFNKGNELLCVMMLLNPTNNTILTILMKPPPTWRSPIQPNHINLFINSTILLDISTWNCIFSDISLMLNSC